MSALLTAPQRLRTIRLYGKMGTRFGREFRLAVSSPAEAVQALCTQLDGFEHYLMNAKDQGFGFAVFLGRRNLAEDELGHPPGDEDIRIAPVVFGSKNSGWLNVLVGAVLVVVGVLVGVYVDPGLGAAIVGAGISMIVGGVVQLLFPPPKMKGPHEGPQNTPSYAFAGPVNTQAQGHPVPLLIGRFITGSAVISAGIEAKDEVYVPVGGATNTGGGGGANQVNEGGAWRWGTEVAT